MPGDNEFRLKFGGYVDQQELKKNVQETISEINKQNSGSGKGVKIPILNVDDVKNQGTKIIDATKDVKKELEDMYKSLGKVTINQRKNMNGQIDQFKVTIDKDGRLIDNFIFKLVELKDAEDNAFKAFVQTTATNTDKSLGSAFTKQIKDLEKYRAIIDAVLNDHVRVNGSKLFLNGENTKKITDEAVEAIGKIEALKKTAMHICFIWSAFFFNASRNSSIFS